MTEPPTSSPQPLVSGLDPSVSRLVVFHLSFVILLLPALQPLFAADFTCGYDNGFHLWRAVQVEHLLRQGVLFSRWAPDMAHGYGYPLFDFTAPASAYTVALMHMLGLTWPWALNLTFALGWVLAAYAVYLFVSDLFDRYAGLVAAVLYTYAPFHAYDVFYRGGLSQSSAWLFPPLILWALRRADKRVGFAVTGLGFAGLILTHNAFALLFAPLLLAYLLVVGYQKDRGVALRGGLALLVGLGLSAFFWLPALADLSFVHSERLSGAWVFEYANNFLPVEQLLAPPRNADPTLINDWPARGLGLIPTLLAVIGIPALRNRQRRPQVVFFAAALLLYLFLTLPISRPVWDAFPLLQRVQFPWRLVGPATLCTAVLTGGVLPTDRPTNRRSLIAAALILLLVLGNLGWFYPRHCSPPQDTSIAGMIAWERASDTLGTTAKGEYLPIWVHHMPSDSRADSADRLLQSDLPAGARILSADYGPFATTVELETPLPFRATYRAFYYPGWRVAVDGAPIPITPTEPDGLISFDVPAGHHTVRVHFGETPLRLVADILSLLSLAAGILAYRHIGEPANSTDHQPTGPPIHQSTIILALLLLAFKLTLIDRFDTPPRRANLVDDHLRNADVLTEIAFGHDKEFILLGHDELPSQGVPGGERFEVTTYWRALRPGGPDYGVTVNVVDAEGYRWNGADIRPPRWHRTPPPVWEWPTDQYALVALSIPLLPGTPPGTYTIEMVAFDRDTLAPLTAYDATGRALGPALPLGQVAVTAPRRPPDPDTLAIRHRLDVPLGPLTLLGADFDRDTAAPGDPVLLTTFWRTDGAGVKGQRSSGTEEQGDRGAEELTAHLTLLAPDGSAAAEYDFPPTVAWHPASAWNPGDLWRGQQLLHLPAHLQSATYTWTLSLSLSPRPLVPLSQIHVTAPDRTYTPPPVDLEINAPLGDVATLVGLTLSPRLPAPLSPGHSLTTTLIWRAESETNTSYHVFLHLIGPDGNLVAQSDSIPAGWTRPTTGWLPGEYITDVHPLTVPPGTPAGDYTLFAGLYAPGSDVLSSSKGERVTAPDGNDAIPLTTITIDKVR